MKVTVLIRGDLSAGLEVETSTEGNPVREGWLSWQGSADPIIGEVRPSLKGETSRRGGSR